MVQGRGAANSSAKANFAFADEWFTANSSAKANFAFADEWFKVGGRQIRRQRQILPLPTNGSRSGVGKFVGKGKMSGEGSREGRGICLKGGFRV